MEFSIRKATKEDYESVSFLFRQVHELHVSERPDLYKENSTPVTQETFNSQLDDEKQHIFVATIEKEIVGVIVMEEVNIAENPFVNERKILLINSICTATAHQKKGIGKRMMKYAFDFGKNLNADSIELNVLENNQNAIEFYQSIGMTTKSRKMEFRFN